MTSDEYRAKCIEAEAIAAFERYNDSPWICASEDEKKHWIWTMTAAFDSIHGIARVVPIEATEEMVKAGSSALVRWESSNDPYSANCVTAVYKAMSAAGRLTSPPEKKP